MEGVILPRAPSSKDLLLRTAAEISLFVGILPTCPPALQAHSIIPSYHGYGTRDLTA